MQTKNKKGVFAIFALAAALLIALAAVPAATVSAAGGGDILYRDNFGGSGADIFEGVAATSDGGYVAVGYSYATSFGDGDWSGISGKGNYDAIIVKFRADGSVAWRTNFGGSGFDYFTDVAVTSDGYVAVGYSYATSFGNGDWGLTSGKGESDAIIVKFNTSGGLVWKNNFGGFNHDYFYGVTATSGGFVAVGYSAIGSFNNGNWAGIPGKGNYDAIIVKFDTSGGLVWKNNFGGSAGDYFGKVTAVSDGGFVAVGYSAAASFGNNDWLGVTGKGNDDAIIVKFDADGVAGWRTNFGGSGYDCFNSVIETSDGFVAVGNSDSSSFGNNDWSGITGKGDYDATIVKFNTGGVAVWKNNFGGSGYDIFHDLTKTSDGFVAVGNSDSSSFGNNDWSGITGKGDYDATIVKFDTGGIPEWENNFGGFDHDYFKGVTAVSDGGFAAVGYSVAASFGSGNWSGISGKGDADAAIVKYGTFVPVTDISGVPSSATAGTPLTLTGTAVPSGATYKAISWSVKNAGITGATVSGNALSVPNAGAVIVTATVADGKAVGTPYEKDFTITVTAAAVFVPVTDVTLVGTSSMTAGTPMTLLGSVVPSNATYKNITWSVTSDGGAGASIAGNMLSADDPGTVTVTATVANGKAVGTDFTKTFTITVTGDSTVDPGDDDPDGSGGSNVWLWVAVGVFIALCAVIAIVLLRRKNII